ncbi:Glycine dehydrogenase [decarboxylating] (glycine cleavage system P2 protein) [hydrothermal vent metagenome]|uniref:glycine dehydrogenase (aminomethyl-transferring) n=1 Tax=hydrothermal vent metagenome TaxID=652676 RepID=A0A3B1D4C5_9ZZZZ
MKLIFEKSVEGRRGFLNAQADVDVGVEIPTQFLRQEACPFPEVSELEVVRHFTALSQLNFSIDTNFYPLGSCTMKYNPKFTEAVTQIPGFAHLHPLLPQLRKGEKWAQGALEVLYEMEYLLGEMTGMDAFTMQPLAGAHGELTGVMMMAAYHKAKGNHKKHIIVPDSSHGTNPATASIAGYTIVSVPSDESGSMDLKKLQAAITDETAGLMLTCPNTHGIFNSDIEKIAEMIHAVDGIMYYDGANLNAILGRCRPGDIGFDVMHINVHKTFATPHGGGGPGAGPVGVNKKLEPYLPISRIKKNEKGHFYLDYDYSDSIGYIASFYGNFAIILRAYAYILLYGAKGLKEISNHAVLNANYIKQRLKEKFVCAYDRTCMHESVFSASIQAKRGVHAIDIAKFLIDQGIHPPTVYFPLTVKEAIMIEPTETESKQAMDEFIEAMFEADKLSETFPEDFHDLPKTTPVSRPDEVKAAREMDVNYFGK